jgi:hypothetical protein
MLRKRGEFYRVLVHWLLPLFNRPSVPIRTFKGIETPHPLIFPPLI